MKLHSTITWFGHQTIEWSGFELTMLCYTDKKRITITASGFLRSRVVQMGLGVRLQGTLTKCIEDQGNCL